MSLTVLLIGFSIALAFVLITIIKYKMHPVMSLLLGGILMGIIGGLKLGDIATKMSTGFGNTLAGIGIIILWGVVLGNLLHKSGCTEQIASLMLRMTGEKRTPLAIALTGYIVSIPVFFDAAFVILINLVRDLSRKGKIPFVTLVTSLAVGLITTHAMVIPTPGPLAVAGSMGVNLGWFFVYGAIISLAGVLAAGVYYAKAIGRLPQNAAVYSEETEDASTFSDKSANKPSGGLGIFLILLPIILILVGTLGKQFVDAKSFGFQLFSFVGDKNIALLAGAIVAYACLRPFLKLKFEEIITESCNQSGIILLITGAGGAFGAIINATGIGDKLVANMKGLTSASATILMILVAWVISQVLRAAQGSTTVALITTSALLAPLVAKLGVVSPVLVGLAICAGGIGISLPNDSGFWVVNRFSGFSIKQTFQSWTIGGTIAGVVSLIVILILSFFQSALPGLF